MASGPITSWKIDGETMETVRDFILGGSKITADGNCRHEIKRCLLLGRKTMTHLDRKFKKATSEVVVMVVKVSPSQDYPHQISLLYLYSQISKEDTE